MKNAPNFSPNYLSLCFVGPKKIPQIPAKFPAKFPCEKSNNSPMIFWRRAGRTRDIFQDTRPGDTEHLAVSLVQSHAMRSLFLLCVPDPIFEGGGLRIF